MNRILFHAHTRDDITKMARQGYVIVVPLASIEQHGPHLPVFTDSIISDYIVSQSVLKASQSMPILMTPLFTVGNSDLHLSFGGTISLSSSTYLHMLRDIGESLVTCGFSKIVFLNGHGGNESLMVQTATDLATQHPIWTAAATYWNIARTALQEINVSEVGPVPGHAGGFETSMILALQPELVHKEHLTKTTHVQKEWNGLRKLGNFVGKYNEIVGVDGYTDAANKATAEKGKQYLDVIVRSVSEWLLTTYNAVDADE